MKERLQKSQMPSPPTKNLHIKIILNSPYKNRHYQGRLVCLLWTVRLSSQPWHVSNVSQACGDIDPLSPQAWPRVAGWPQCAEQMLALSPCACECKGLRNSHRNSHSNSKHLLSIVQRAKDKTDTWIESVTYFLAWYHVYDLQFFRSEAFLDQALTSTLWVRHSQFTGTETEQRTQYNFDRGLQHPQQKALTTKVEIVSTTTHLLLFSSKNLASLWLLDWQWTSKTNDPITLLILAALGSEKEVRGKSCI